MGREGACKHAGLPRTRNWHIYRPQYPFSTLPFGVTATRAVVGLLTALRRGGGQGRIALVAL